VSARKGAPTLPAPRKSSIVFAVGVPIARADIPGLCDALGALLVDTDAKVVDCEVDTLSRPDAVTVEALARLQLTALRRGARIRVRNASPELCELIEFMGLRASMSAGATRRLG
jgi:ABC-type transporter Mla MlaB component